MSTAHIGARVAQARRERDLTQAQLAGATSFSLSLVNAVEQGRDPASHAFTTTTTVAHALSLELGWLLGQDQVHRHRQDGDPTAAAALRAAVDAYDDPQLSGAVHPLVELESMFANTERWWRNGSLRPDEPGAAAAASGAPLRPVVVAFRRSQLQIRWGRFDSAAGSLQRAESSIAELSDPRAEAVRCSCSFGIRWCEPARATVTPPTSW